MRHHVAEDRVDTVVPVSASNLEQRGLARKEMRHDLLIRERDPLFEHVSVDDKHACILSPLEPPTVKR